MAYYVEPQGFSILVNECLRGASRLVLEGGIAHELAHILRDSRLGSFQRRLAFRRYQSSRAYRIRDESDTELTLIERGYGRQLLEFVRYARTLGYRFGRDEGLPIGKLLRLVRYNPPPAGRR